MIYLIKIIFSKIKKIKKNGFVLNIDGYNLKYKKPKFTSQACIIKGKTYSTTLFLSISIKYKDIYICN